MLPGSWRFNTQFPSGVNLHVDKPVEAYRWCPAECGCRDGLESPITPSSSGTAPSKASLVLITELDCSAGAFGMTWVHSARSADYSVEKYKKHFRLFRQPAGLIRRPEPERTDRPGPSCSAQVCSLSSQGQSPYFFNVNVLAQVLLDVLDSFSCGHLYCFHTLSFYFCGECGSL